jgi:hypothetical protein
MTGYVTRGRRYVCAAAVVILVLAGEICRGDHGHQPIPPPVKPPSTSPLVTPPATTDSFPPTTPPATTPGETVCPECDGQKKIVNGEGLLVDCPHCEGTGILGGTAAPGTKEPPAFKPDPDLTPEQRSFVARMTVEEPVQEAVIAWNGSEEILVLSTQLKASQKGRLLEIIPLPSRPDIDEGDPELFGRLHATLQEKQPPDAPIGREPVEVLFTKKIGPHHLHVVRALNEGEFVVWAQFYLQNTVGVQTEFSPKAQQILRSYIQEGYRYFVLDIIDADTDFSKRTALRYRFKTNHLFYPVRITALGGTGETRAKLLVLSKGLLSYSQRRLPPDFIHTKRFQPVQLSYQELRDASKELTALFQTGDTISLRRWDVFGDVAKIPGDLRAWP